DHLYEERRGAQVEDEWHVRDLLYGGQDGRRGDRDAHQNGEQKNHAEGDELLSHEIAGPGVIDHGKGLLHDTEQRRASQEQTAQAYDEQQAALALHATDGLDQLGLLLAVAGDGAENGLVHGVVRRTEEPQRKAEQG